MRLCSQEICPAPTGPGFLRAPNPPWAVLPRPVGAALVGGFWMRYHSGLPLFRSFLTVVARFCFRVVAALIEQRP